MATIIELRARATRSHPEGASHGGSADVIIFPGVRYERVSADPLAPEPAMRRRSRKRDRLELED